MAEQCMADLFLAHHPTTGDVLGEDGVAHLNRTLAKVYAARTEEGSASTPPPEPLPMRPLDYTAFQTQMHQALARLCVDDTEEPAFLAELVEEARRPAALEEPMACGRPALWAEAQEKVCSRRRPCSEEHGLISIEGAEADMPCCAPALPSADELRALLKAQGVAGRQAMGAARAYRTHAAESSKQMLGTLKECGASAVMASKSFGKQVLAGEGAATALIRLLASHKVQRGAPAAQARQVVTAEIVEPPREDCPQQELQQDQKVTAWRFDAGDGAHINIRSVPAIDGPQTGCILQPGEVFQVSREWVGREGVLFLELSNGRGWVFDSKPGVGIMCVRA